MKVVVALPIDLIVAGSTPPKADIVRTGTEVNASLGKTWDAVIDQFAARNIPIRNMERSSGFISTEPLKTTFTDYKGEYYDCGKEMGAPRFADRAIYNAVVRGDSSRATVRVTVKYSITSAKNLMGDPTSVDCTTQGKWETDFEAAVKAAAESAK